MNSPNARLDATIVVLTLMGVAQLFLGLMFAAVLAFVAAAGLLIVRLIEVKRSRDGDGL